MVSILSKCPNCYINHPGDGPSAYCRKPQCQAVKKVGVEPSELALVQQPVAFTDVGEMLDDAEPNKIDRRFERFDKKNPRLFILFRDKALELIRSGVKFYGMKALYEEVRFDHKVRTSGQDEKPMVKLSNDFTSRYSRKLMDEVPELRGFFKTRTLRKGEA